MFMLRRCPDNAGCRYLARGVDANGVAANSVLESLYFYTPSSQVEKENIIVDKVAMKIDMDTVKSAIYVARGSIPLYFTQPITKKRVPKIYVGENSLVTVQGDSERFSRIIEEDIQTLNRANDFVSNYK